MFQLLDSIFTVCSYLSNFLQPFLPLVVTPLDTTSSHTLATEYMSSCESVHSNPSCDEDALAKTASQLNMSTEQLADIRQSCDEFTAAADIEQAIQVLINNIPKWYSLPVFMSYTPHCSTSTVCI